MYKTVVLAEMAYLYLADIMIAHDKRNQSWVETFTTVGLSASVAIAILLTLLLLMCDMGLGKEAALIGLAIILSSVIVTGGSVAAALNNILGESEKSV